jgi:hypothetical protein
MITITNFFPLNLFFAKRAVGAFLTFGPNELLYNFNLTIFFFFFLFFFKFFFFFSESFLDLIYFK